MLKVSARRHGVSENALAESILMQNLQVDPLVQAFDFVCIGKETFVSLLGMANADGLEIIGAERGKKSFLLAKELFESNNLELNFGRFISEVLGSQARWFKVEGTGIRPERITLQHAYGAKWSGFLKSYLSSAFEVESRSKLEIVAAGDYVGVRFPGVASR